MSLPEPATDCGNKYVPASFEELIAGMERKFQKVDEELIKMHERLDKENATSEALGRRLLGQTIP